MDYKTIRDRVIKPKLTDMLGKVLSERLYQKARFATVEARDDRQRSKTTGQPVTFACLQNPVEPDQWRRLLRQNSGKVLHNVFPVPVRPQPVTGTGWRVHPAGIAGRRGIRGRQHRQSGRGAFRVRRRVRRWMENSCCRGARRR